MGGHLDYPLLLDACDVVSQFLLACSMSCVLDNTVYHIVVAVYAELLLLVPTFVWGFSLAR